MPGKYLFSSKHKRSSLFKHLSNHPLRPSSPSHAATLPPLQSGENVFEKFRLFPLIPPPPPPRWSLTTPSLPLSLLRASSSTDKIGPRQRPRRAAKLRVGKEKGVGRVNSSPKAWPSLQICVARSVSWRFPGSSCKLRYSLCNPPPPLSNPRLSAPTLLEITEAHRRRNRR